MQMRSFAMLLPCGISLFSGVEFVCCPKHFKGERDVRIFFTIIALSVPRGGLKHRIHRQPRSVEKKFITQFILLPSPAINA
jgi:hypothetical protein